MGLFNRKKEGGLMDVIRCDEQEYLVWKWRPSGEANSTKKENSIRYGSSLRVKDGEVAVFVYPQEDGKLQDFIEGPHDRKIETANFPVLTGLVGMAWGGNSPFQAEVYFINLAGIIQIKFGVPYFDVYDPRFLDFGVPVAVRGSISFNITDYRAFVKLHRMINFDLDSFKTQVKDTVVKRVKGIISNAPTDCQIPVVQLERKIMEISDVVQNYLSKDLSELFGVNVRSVDISAIEPDKESEGWRELRKVTASEQLAQVDINIKNNADTQRINAENMQETLRIQREANAEDMRVQREESQRYQKLQTETNFMAAHALNQQTEVLKEAAKGLGKGNGGGMNLGGAMTSMMMGGAMGKQMASMVDNMGQQMQQSMNTPPPVPNVMYHVSVNGAQSGPFNMQQLQQMAQAGTLTAQSYVWKQGMPSWAIAGTQPDLATLFAPSTPGAMPPPPPVM